MVVWEERPKVDIRKRNYYVETLAEPGMWVTSGYTFDTSVNVAGYSTKTIQGWTTTNLKIRIYISPSGEEYFHPYPYYEQTVSSGTTFCLSFSEACGMVRVEFEALGDGQLGAWICCLA